MVPTVYVGLALTSHNSSSLGTATFDNVTVQPGWPVAPAAPAGLTATAGDGSVALNWSASATATNYFVKRSLDERQRLRSHRDEHEPGIHQSRA